MADLIDVNSVVSGMMGIGSLLAVVLIVGLIIGALYLSGILRRRKYTCFIAEPRANGSVQIFQAKGDYLPNDKFEVFFGPFDIMRVQKPKGECICPGNQIHGYSNQRNDVTWIPGANLHYDTTEIRAEPALDPGMKIMVSQTLKEEFERYKVQDKWKEYLPLMSIVVAALIIILPIMLGLGQIADKLGLVGSGINSASSVLSKGIDVLHNATISNPTKPPLYPGG